MVTVGIMGAGKAAALHAQTALASPQVELVGVHCRHPETSELLAEHDIASRSAEELHEQADGLIIAVPPAEVINVVNAIGDTSSVKAILVEPPFRFKHRPSLPAVTACNLLHAPATRQALADIAQMSHPHHLQLRVRQPAPDWGEHRSGGFGGPLYDPGLRLAPLLLAAAGEPAVRAEVSTSRDSARVVFHLQSGRAATMSVLWAPGSARIELEAADADGVVTLKCDPLPRLERNGVPVAQPRQHPLIALGFLAQLERFALTCEGRAPWPDLTLGQSIEALVR